jgi:hypothetical protein
MLPVATAPEPKPATAAMPTLAEIPIPERATPSPVAFRKLAATPPTGPSQAATAIEANIRNDGLCHAFFHVLVSQL